MNTSKKYKVAGWFREEFEALQTDPTFVAEGIILDITEQILQFIEEHEISQAEIGRRLAKIRGVESVSRSAISQLLSGNQNISIRRLVEVALALGMTITPPQLVPLQLPEIEVVGPREWETIETRVLSTDSLATLWEQTSARKASSLPTRSPIVREPKEIYERHGTHEVHDRAHQMVTSYDLSA